MKGIFILLFLCLVHSVRAANYYFSSSGSDSRTLSEAQNPATPWKTINKLNSFFPELKPGDSVLFKRNETFYGSIVLKKSGLTAQPIVIGAYGSGKKPVITSFITLGDWVSTGKGIWETVNAALATSVNMVVLNGVPYGMGRYPNADAANGGYLNFESHQGKTSITDNELTSGTNWKGAELVLRPRRWMLERSPITGHSGKTLSYTSTSPYVPFDNYGYFIQNSLKTLDKFGEWYFNPATKKMSVYFGTANPSSQVLQVTTMGDLISSVRYSNVVFDNLVLKGSNGSGFNIVSGSGIRIQNCDILFSGKNAVFATNHSNLEVINCTLSHQHNNGIDLEKGDNAIIKNNRISNTYVIPGMGINGQGMGIGIVFNSNNSLVEYNEIKNTGYQGIYFNGSDVLIKNNLIDTFCITKDDGAGIYSNKGDVVFRRRKIVGNIILNGIGIGKGTNDTNKVAAHGVYMDNNASEAEFLNNTMAHCASSGVYIHNSFGMTINNNTIYNNKVQINMTQDADNVPIRNCIVDGNLLFSKLNDQFILYLKSSGNDIKSFGKFDNNYYARPVDDKLIIYNGYNDAKGVWTVKNFDLEGWRQTYGQDKNSKRTAKQIAPFTISSLVGNNKFVNGGDFTNDIKGIAATSCVVSHGIAGILGKGYLQVTPSSAESAVYFRIGEVSEKKNYVVSYSLKGSSGSNMTLGTFLRQGESPYATLTPVQSNTIKTSQTEHELLFSPSSTTSSASVVFKADAKYKYYLDNIKVYEAKAKITDPDDSIRFAYNKTAASKSIALNGTYVDSKGKTYSGNIDLPAYSSLVLIKTSSGAKNAAPLVSLKATTAMGSVAPLSSITFSASASDADGSIAKVEFYNGSILLTTENKPTYDCTIDAIVPGNYSITAKATDNEGLSATSSPIVFTVPALNTPPVVNITAPAITSGFTSPATIDLNAVATDADGTISKVEFYNGSTLLVSEYKPPYTYNWQNVPAGTYTLTARATDNNGLVATSAQVKVTVRPQALREAPNAPPANVSTLNPSGIASDPESGNVTNPWASTGLPDFRLFPNPAVNTIQVSFNALQGNQKATLTLYNISGAVLKQYPVVAGKIIDIDVSSLAPGTYIARISGENFNVNKKFLKVK